MSTWGQSEAILYACVLNQEGTVWQTWAGTLQENPRGNARRLRDHLQMSYHCNYTRVGTHRETLYVSGRPGTSEWIGAKPSRDPYTFSRSLRATSGTYSSVQAIKVDWIQLPYTQSEEFVLDFQAETGPSLPLYVEWKPEWSGVKHKDSEPLYPLYSITRVNNHKKGMREWCELQNSSPSQDTMAK